VSKPFATLCGRIFRDADPQYFPSARHKGRKIILCAEACLGAFLADPDVFCKAHRNPGNAAAKTKTEIEDLTGFWSRYDSSAKSD